MIQKICIAILVLLCSCKQNKTEEKETSQKDSTSKIDTLKSNITLNYRFYPNTNWLKNIPKDSITEMYWKEIVKRDSLNKEIEHALVNSFPLKDKTIIFLWENLINQQYCKAISEPERAALGYLTIFYGTLNGCHYKGEINKEYLIRNTLNFDNEDLEGFKNYMQYWFRDDPKSLDEINYCQKERMYYGSAASYYNKISLTVKGNKIYINCKIEGYSRDIYDNSYTKNFIFLTNNNNIKLIKHITSEPEYIYYYPNGSGELPPKGYINNGHGEYRLPKKSKKK